MFLSNAIPTVNFLGDIKVIAHSIVFVYYKTVTSYDLLMTSKTFYFFLH